MLSKPRTAVRHFPARCTVHRDLRRSASAAPRTTAEFVLPGTDEPMRPNLLLVRDL